MADHTQGVQDKFEEFKKLDNKEGTLEARKQMMNELKVINSNLQYF